MLKHRVLLLTSLALFLTLGSTPLAKAGVEMSVYPEVTPTFPGDTVEVDVVIANHDPVWYSCSLSLELRFPNGHVHAFPYKHFRLPPMFSVTRPVVRVIPIRTPRGTYVVMLGLYNRSTGELLDDATAYFVV